MQNETTTDQIHYFGSIGLEQGNGSHWAFQPVRMEASDWPEGVYLFTFPLPVHQQTLFVVHCLIQLLLMSLK